MLDCTLNGKAMTVHSIAGLIRLSQYFPEPNECSNGNVKAELDLSNYATKADLKGATGIDTSMLASKADLASLKTKVDNLTVDKLKTVPANFKLLFIVLSAIWEIFSELLIFFNLFYKPLSERNNNEI